MFDQTRMLPGAPAGNAIAISPGPAPRSLQSLRSYLGRGVLPSSPPRPRSLGGTWPRGVGAPAPATRRPAPTPRGRIASGCAPPSWPWHSTPGRRRPHDGRCDRCRCNITLGQPKLKV